MATQRTVELLFKISGNATKELQGIRKELEALQKLRGVYQETRKQSGEVGEEAVKSSKAWVSSLGAVGKAVGLIGLAYGGIRQAIGDAMVAGRGFYEYFIGANERLNSQIISSAANISSVSAIFRDGVKIEDPSEAIAALQPRLREVLKEIQADSVDLVGVTSQDLTGVFQILTTNVSELANQSQKGLADPLQAAGKLTIDFAAALGTLGVPLNQASQEINSLLKGYIDQNSYLSKQLGITNQMVAQWKAQGTLVDSLRSRLEAFGAANALNARSIGGLSSNIKDVIEIISQEAGKPLLEPVIAGLEIVYNFIRDNKDAILAFTSDVINRVIALGAQLKNELQPTFISLVNIVKNLGSIFVDLVPTVGAAISVALKALTPVFDLVEAIAKVLEGVLSTELGKIAVQAGVLLAIAAPLGTALIGAVTVVGQFIAVLPTLIGLMGGLQAAFVGLSAVAIPTITAFAAAVAPFLALAAAAASVATAFQAWKLREANIAIEELRQGTDQLSDETLKYAQELKELNDLEAQNGNLTEEQEKRKAALESITADLSSSLDAQIEQLKTATGANDDQNESIKTQIALLERMKEVLNRQSDTNDLTIANQDIADLGTSAEQLSQRLDQALGRLRNPKDVTQLQQAAKESIDFINQSVETGLLSAKEGRALLEEIAGNVDVELATQQAAQKAITSNIQAESKLRQDAIALEIADIKEQVETGAISRIDAERQVTELTKQQIDERLAALRAEIAAAEARGEDGSRIATLKNQEAQLINELDSLAIESNKRLTQLVIDEGQKRVDAIALEIKEIETQVLRGAIRRSQAEEQITAKTIEQVEARIAAVTEALETAAGSEKRKLTQQLQELNLEREKLAIEGVQKLQAAQLRELEQSQDAALDAVRLAETERITELERLRLREPELAARIEREIVAQRKAGIQESLRLEQERLTFLESQGALTGEAEIQRQDQIRAARQKVADLTGQLVQQEAAAQRALTNEINTEIDRRTQRITQALQAQTMEYEKQLELIRLAGQAENTRLDLLNAQKSLISSRAALEQTVFNIAIAATEDEKKKAQLQEKAGQAKLAAKVRELAIDAQIFEIQQIQRKIELESEKIQARIAQIKSRAALAEAQANAAKIMADPTATREQKAAALLGVKAAEMGVVGSDAMAELTDFKAQTNDALSGLQREAFQNQQKNELLNARFEAAQSIADPGRRSRAIDALSREAQRETGVNANPYVRTVGGGPMSQYASPAMDGITSGFNQLFGGISEKMDNMLQGFNVAFKGLGEFDPNALGASQSTTVSQNNITISQVNFTNRIERDSDRAQLDGMRRAIANDLSQLFNQAATQAA